MISSKGSPFVIRVLLFVPVICPLLAIGATVCTAGSPVLRDANRLRDGSFRGEGRVTIDDKEIRCGDEVKLLVEFLCEGGSAPVNNPFAQESCASPVRIIVFRKDGSYVGDVRIDGSKDYLPCDSRIRLSAGDIVGFQKTLTTTDKETTVTRDPSRTLILALGPGTYRLQAIFNKGFVRRESVEPADNSGNETSADELFRSNATEFMVRPKSAKEGDRRLLGEMDYPGFKSLRVSVRPLAQKVILGETLTTEVMFCNESNVPIRVFNPFLSALLARRPASLYVLDRDGRALGDVLDSTDGSRRRERPSDSVELPPGAMCGTRVTIRCGAAPGSRVVPYPRLSVGKHHLQFVYRQPDDLEEIVAESRFAPFQIVD
jgi:hypothetical protein